MKSVDRLPPILEKLYCEYLDLDTQEKELKKKKAMKKAHILAWMKKEQCDAIGIGIKKAIHIINVKGKESIDKDKLKKLHPGIYNSCTKHGAPTKSLKVSPIPSVVKQYNKEKIKDEH